MLRSIRVMFKTADTGNNKRYSIFRNICDAIYFLTDPWMSLKSAQGCAALLLLLTIFANGCVNLQTAILTPETYHFRKVRWGSTKASVLLAERGKRVHFERGNTLVFKHRHNDVPVLLIYCFHENHRVRAAGYLTANPATLKDPARLFRQELLEGLGEPTQTFRDGGMLWKSEETLTYTNTYLAGTPGVNFPRIGAGFGSGSVLSPRGASTDRPKNWHAVCAYIDMKFYDELNAEGLSVSTLGELSYYEEIMFGLFRKTREKK